MPRNRNPLVRRALSAAAALLLALGALAAPSLGAADQSGDEFAPCGLQAGTLMTALTPDNNTDFVVFGLYDAKGDEVAKQFIPMYNPNASAELMITPIGFGGTIASAKCLADSPVRRCADPNWTVDEGLIVSLVGFVLGPDFVVATVNGRYKRPSSTAQLSIDGALAGFQIDKNPVQWAAFFNSAGQVSQAYFDLKPGAHQLTLGARLGESGAFVPQERLCFQT